MVRRLSSLVAAVLAVVALLVSALPASAYNNAVPFHMSLFRLENVECGSGIGLLVRLEDKHGDAVSGARIHFEITKGKARDTVSPSNVVTNSRGKAVTSVTLVCTNDSRREVKISATGPQGSAARITLTLRKHHDGGDDDDHDGGHRYDRQGSRNTAAGLAVVDGSNGPGGGPLAPAAAVGSSFGLLPLGPVLGLMTVLAAWHRRRSARVLRQATR